MHWLWDNIHLRKSARKRHLILLGAISTFLLFKALFYFYPYHFYKIDPQLVETAFQNPKSQNKSPSPTIKNSPPPSNNEKKTPLIPNISTKTTVKTNHPTNQQKSQKPPVKTPSPTFEYFPFDPNTLSFDSLRLLGISSYAANNILKYREKGGIFKTAEKLKNIYGLDSLTFSKIKSFVYIKPNNKKSNTKKLTQELPQKKSAKKWKKKIPKIIEINSADTTDWMSLPGIGKYRSRRIINFREKLGGFWNIDQVGECYSLPDSIFRQIKQYLTVDTSLVRKQNINLLNKKQLLAHPYVAWRHAKYILSYRDVHGPYQNMNDFYKLYGLEKNYIDTLKMYFYVK